jgi:hypothetical protein
MWLSPQIISTLDTASLNNLSLEISVSNVTDWEMEGREAIPVRGREFSLDHHIQTSLGPTQWVKVKGER